MHISDGILSPQVLAGGAALTAAGTTLGLKELDYEKIPRAAIMASAFFVASLIHIPLGPSSVHLILNGLVGLILGWAAFPVILVALTLQAVLFQFGGLTVLGVNTFNMAFPAFLVFLFLNRLIKKDRGWVIALGSFSAGALAVLFSGIMTAFSLAFTGEEFIPMAKLIVLAHLPVMGVESTITAFIVFFLKKVKPEILEVYHAVPQKA